jgi:hypothetical protein
MQRVETLSVYVREGWGGGIAYIFHEFITVKAP